MQKPEDLKNDVSPTPLPTGQVSFELTRFCADCFLDLERVFDSNH